MRKVKKENIVLSIVLTLSLVVAVMQFDYSKHKGQHDLSLLSAHQQWVYQYSVAKVQEKQNEIEAIEQETLSKWKSTGSSISTFNRKKTIEYEMQAAAKIATQIYNDAPLVGFTENLFKKIGVIK
jgi:hypothetical protein